MLTASEKRRFLRATSGVALLLSLSFVENALSQSGRRASRSAATPAPTPIPIPTPETVAPSQKKFAELNYPVHLLIAKQHTSKHLVTENVIFNSFIHRLNELPNIEGTLIGNLRRDGAAKRALVETDA